MIVNRDNTSLFFYTEGFGVTFPEPFSIHVDSGSLCYFNSDGETFIHYPEFEFDVVGDTELSVVYDVHLLKEGSATPPIQIDRTEMTEDTVAFYSGEQELMHTIITFTINPNDTAENVKVNFNNVEVILP